MISGPPLADLYASEAFSLLRLSPAAWRVFEPLMYEKDGEPTLLWGRRVEVADDLPREVWAETSRGTRIVSETYIVKATGERLW